MRLATWFGVAALMLLAGDTAMARGGMEVIDAWYGTSGRSCDARGVVRATCEGRDYCEVRADNNLCGDPAGGDRKDLFISYSCGDGLRTITVREREIARAYCRSDRGAPVVEVPSLPGRRCRNRADCAPLGQHRDQVFIAEATYGIDGRYCDATEALQRSCDGHGRCQVKAGNQLCGDPAKGDRKQLEVDYVCNGSYDSESAWEDRLLVLSCP